ncbi:SWIM zinc finger family protein [Nocardia sp. NPDC058640]|uniref:SWIM zinc finger family protein n=1 Tax=Nocardia sp. NPDC058640 TaxID=3346571 RepID=UPI00365EB51E
MSFPAAQTLSYRRPSSLEQSAGRSVLDLQTADGRAGVLANPTFFRGFVTQPAVAAAGLLAVADVAAADYFDRERWASLDPVITANGDRLRFEAFSGCCGVHARLDVLPSAIDGETGYGTTNVDVNNPLRDALSGFMAEDPLHLTVGPDELAVATIGERVVEKKVPLPPRWLRGFAETQVIAAGFDLQAQVSAAEAVRFLRTVPRSRTPGSIGGQWVVATGGRLRITSRPGPGVVSLPGPHRLGALRRVLRHAQSLRLYGPPTQRDSRPSASAWEVGLPGMRLTLMLSPGVGRGFSGEGASLAQLAGANTEADAELLSVLLAWDRRIELGDLAHRSGLPVERVRAALTRLGVDGRVGYDIADATFYHRELPYRTGRAERDNPRLQSARALVADGSVRVDPADPLRARVVTADATYQVTVDPAGAFACTCQWWTEHRGDRGPCKHALAVRIVGNSARTAL